MPRFGKKKPLSEYLYTWPVVIVLFLALAVFASAVWKRFTVEREMAARSQEALAHKAELLKRKGNLEKEVQYLSGDRGMEEEIRKHFDVVKDGEQVVILVGKDGEENAASSSEPKPPKKPWYQFW
jgi:hypothetical protein